MSDLAVADLPLPALLAAAAAADAAADVDKGREEEGCKK